MATQRVDVEGGYDVAFVDPLDKDYECPICLLAVRDPVQTPCGHSFCKSCFDRVARRQGGADSVECPIDKQRISISEVFNDVKVKRKVLSLNVKCSNQLDYEKEKGFGKPRCRWVGALSDYQHHLNKCDYVTVKCDNDCGMDVKRCELSHHKLFVCGCRIMICGSCNDELEQRQLQHHLTVCPKLPVSCPLRCGLKVNRENMEDHVSETGDCPNTVFTCPFKDAGCDVTCKRLEVDGHLTDNVVQHQMKQQRMIKRLSDDNFGLRQTLKHLFSAASQDMLSSCGRVVLRYSMGEQRTGRCYTSSTFLAHHKGYKAEILVYPNGYLKEKTLSIALRPTQGESDDLLIWPFAIPHSIAVVDQRENGKNITKAIDPTKLDAAVHEYWFKNPSFARATSRCINLVEEDVMLTIPHDVLATRSYLKDGIVVINVEVDN